MYDNDWILITYLAFINQHTAVMLFPQFGRYYDNELTRRPVVSGRRLLSIIYSKGKSTYNFAIYNWNLFRPYAVHAVFKS